MWIIQLTALKIELISIKFNYFYYNLWLFFKLFDTHYCLLISWWIVIAINAVWALTELFDIIASYYFYGIPTLRPDRWRGLARRVWCPWLQESQAEWRIKNDEVWILLYHSIQQYTIDLCNNNISIIVFIDIIVLNNCN